MEVEKIRGHDDYFIGEDGSVFKRMKTWNNSGYETIKLSGVHYKIHELVADKFLPLPRMGEIPVHKDGDKSNNHYRNLEWAKPEPKKKRKSSFQKGKSPVQNRIKCGLYYKNELIGQFPSIRMAVKMAETMGAKTATLEKYKKQGDFQIRQQSVTTSP